jgi:hypothetical protein
LDADPDIPILKQAKAEYAKLNNYDAKNCDAGVTQNLPTLPELTSLTVNDD